MYQKELTHHCIIFGSNPDISHSTLFLASPAPAQFGAHLSPVFINCSYCKTAATDKLFTILNREIIHFLVVQTLCIKGTHFLSSHCAPRYGTQQRQDLTVVQLLT